MHFTAETEAYLKWIIFFIDILLLWIVYFHIGKIYSFLDNCWFYFVVFCGVIGYISFAKTSTITMKKNGEIIKEIRIG